MILDLGQLQTGFDWIQVTAQYSNAVLVAMLPYVNDVAQKLDLPIPHPITAEHLSYFDIAPRRNFMVAMGVQGGWHFGFSRGYVDTIQGPHSYFTLQDPDEIPNYYGTLRMTKAEAVELARKALRKLSIPLADVFAEQEPRVTEPEKIGTNIVPHYRVQWLDPRGGFPCTDIEINGETKSVARIHLMSVSLHKLPPKIDVIPQRDPRSPYRPTRNSEYAQKLIPIVLHAIDEYARTLSLPVPQRLTTNQVACFSLADNWGWPHAEIELTNGWKFIYRNSMVNGHYAPDNLFNSDNRPIRIKEFAGKQNLTEQEAIELVRKNMSKFNYPTNLVHMDFQPKFFRPALPGIPRLFIFWNTENEDDLQSKVEAEVDLDKGKLKSLYYDDKAYWNKPPPIDVPLTMPRNVATNSAQDERPRQLAPKAPSRPFTPFISPGQK